MKAKIVKRRGNNDHNSSALPMPIKVRPYMHQQAAFNFTCEKFGLIPGKEKSRGVALLMEIITIGAQTLTSFGNGLYLCAQDGHLIAQVPSIGTGTPTSLTNGQFLFANNGNIGSKEIALADLSDGVIKAGDTITYSSSVVSAAGSILNSSKEIQFNIPLGRTITAASATISTGTVTIRTVNGYAYDKASASGGSYSGLDITRFSPACSLHKGTGVVRVRIVNDTKWVQSSGTAITNNTPVNVNCNFTISFS